MCDPVSQQRARTLRKRPTDAERYLWRFLRFRQLKGVRFRRQVPIGVYIADFASIEARLVIEVDGGQHQDSLDYDRKRDREIERRGYRVLRFWDNQVLSETLAVVEEIARVLDEIHPHPDLPPQAGEGAENEA